MNEEGPAAPALPPLKKGGRGGFAGAGRRNDGHEIPLDPPFSKGETDDSGVGGHHDRQPAAAGFAPPAAVGTLALFRLFAAPLLRRPGRALLSVLAIALGVALGVAVATIHRSALDEFGRGLRLVAGSADARIAGPRDGFDETLYGRLARHPDVAWAAPVLEVEARLAGRHDADGSLRLLGIDPLRAWRLQPALIPPPAADADRRGDGDALGLLAEATLALSPAAAQSLGVGVGDRLRFVAGSGAVELKVIALLPAVAGQKLGVADIATLQAAFARLGRISRIDLQFAGRHPDSAALAALAAELPPGVTISAVGDGETRAAQLSRAYRVNLGLLALIALLTGAFLVFSAQAAGIVRRRGELAFLRAIGLERRALLAGLLAEAAAVGVVGSLLGATAGLGLAALALRLIGSDLGGGYFDGATPQLAIAGGELALQVALGIGAAVAGAWLPAREAAATPPALALKAGDDERALAGLDHAVPGLACLLLGAAALLAPPLAGLPLGAYAAIGLWLAGAVLLLPRLARLVFARLPAGRDPARRLALAQLRGAPGLASVGCAGVLAATAVAAAMAIMVASFRDSVDRWLTVVLPAELYARTSRGGETGFLDPALQKALATLPGLAGVDFIRHANLVLDARLPPVAVIARPLTGPPAALVGPALTPPPGATPLWASEAMADLYGWRAGQRVELPLAGQRHAFVVAGFWRDYARSFGAVMLDLDAWRRLTGDSLANDAALHLAPATSPDTVLAALRALPGGELFEVVDAATIRQKSLAIFDRTFAVTYALEAAAIVIGLAGVAAAFAALAAGRLREFGMLAHLGLGRRELRRLIATEGLATAGLGIAVGLALAFLIALVLIHVVNRQSFHWSMDLAVPWGALAGFAAAMLASAAAAALIAARGALGARAVRAVREDW